VRGASPAGSVLTLAPAAVSVGRPSVTAVAPVFSARTRTTTRARWRRMPDGVLAACSTVPRTRTRTFASALDGLARGVVPVAVAAGTLLVAGVVGGVVAPVPSAAGGGTSSSPVSAASLIPSRTPIAPAATTTAKSLAKPRSSSRARSLRGIIVKRA
jgi:hypothetical protein